MTKLLLLIFLPIYGYAQNTIGLPDVINYSKQTYSAGLQNWDIKQDKNGIIYIANNEGLLCFDGNTWTIYPLPNRTIVRSVEIGLDNRIYVGGQDEMGYFFSAKNGQLEYKSLSSLIPQKDKPFGDVWDIIAQNKNVFFRSEGKIFKFTGESIVPFYAHANWTFLGLCNGRLYAQDTKWGMMEFENEAWSPLSLKSELPLNDPITSILPVGKDSAMVSTLKNGLFIFSKAGIVKLQTINNRLFENDRIYAATLVNPEQIALATNNSGVYIIDLKGNVVQSFSRKEGLQNNDVLSIFPDHQGNLWLGLDNGIDLVTYNSAIKQINPFFEDGAGYTAAIFQNHLYIGTNNGLYNVLLQPLQDLSFSKGDFKLVANAKGQCWGLAEINNQLLLGNHEGAFVIKDNVAQAITHNTGFWNFVPLSGTFPSVETVAGNYKGLLFLHFENGQFQPSFEVPGLVESSRFVAIDKQDNIWVSHPYNGIFKISGKGQTAYSITTYSNKNGLPSTLNNHIYKIRNEVVAATEKGIYIYNSKKDSFEPSAYYKKIFGNQSVRYLKEDPTGNIWFIHEKSFGVVDFATREPGIIYLPELNSKMLSGLEFIYPYNENNIFLGGENGFFLINYNKYKKTSTELTVQVRSVRISNQSDSLLFGGYFKPVNEPQVQDADNIPEIANAWKSIRFGFSAALFGFQSNLEYSYRLKGFNENWSDWGKRTEKEYTNLPAGKLVFEVKARNNLGKESDIASFSFKVLPPWYQTIWANIAYLFLLIMALYAVYLWQQNKFKQQQLKHEQEQKKLRYIHELELNKTESELVVLRNEKLEAEINFKNSELASSAMHLLKKGELQTKLKSELSSVMKELDNPQVVGDLKKMVKSISEDDNMDAEWENFTNHFDTVHSDFLSLLKEKHPGITPNEQKLSAYLRMNLSTKEIAQLMNISVRGVEISRYRLRKKLQIPTETSLFDYLISVKGKS